MSITKADVRDLDFLDADELEATGKTSYKSDIVVVSTENATRIVTFDSGTLLLNGDLPTEPDDIIVLSGTTGADGTYTVATVPSDTTLTVVESIVDSTGGLAAFLYREGARKIGYNNTESGLAAENVQDAIDELSSSVIGFDVNLIFNDESWVTLADEDYNILLRET